VPVVKVDQLRCASCLASAVISLLPYYRAQEILFRNPSDRMTKDPPLRPLPRQRLFLHVVGLSCIMISFGPLFRHGHAAIGVVHV